MSPQPQQYPLETFPLIEKLAHEPLEITTSNVTLPTLERLQATIPEDLDAKSVGKQWFNAFSNAIVKGDVPAIEGLLTEDAFWRDMLSLTWEFRTFQQRAKVSKFLSDVLPERSVAKLTLREDSVQLQQPFPDLVWITGNFDFETKDGVGFGIFRLVPPSAGHSGWKAHMIYTNLEDLKAFPEQIGNLRVPVPQHGTWREQRARELAFEDNEPAVVIVGGGQSGLGLAARLKTLNVSTLVVDKHARVGDNWRGRYEALCLHDPVWYDHMPYLPFPPTWPIYCPAPKLADWLESYAQTMDINVWTSSTVEKVDKLPSSKGWSVVIRRGDGTARVVKPRHVVFAHGFGGGELKMPKIRGMDEFEGKIIHSGHHKTAKDHVGKKVVVVGACTSGHDVAQDHYNHGVDVTMYQRSPTYVISTKQLPIFFGGVYWAEPMPTELADRVSASFPTNLMRHIFKRVVNITTEQDRELLEGLKKKGFQLTFGKDGSGALVMAFERLGGYYLDVGASQLIIDGKIKLKSGSNISHLSKNSIVFEDGTELPADVVIFATGLGDFRTLITKVAGEEISSKVGPILGFDEEGEINSCWRHSGVEGLHIMLGNLGYARFYSKHVALQIKAMEEGLLGQRYTAKAVQ